jgi:hypothetical protein
MAAKKFLIFASFTLNTTNPHKNFEVNAQNFQGKSLISHKQNVKMSIISLILAESQIFYVLPAHSRELDYIEPDIL